jgi:hypothetical protein
MMLREYPVSTGNEKAMSSQLEKCPLRKKIPFPLSIPSTRLSKSFKDTILPSRSWVNLGRKRNSNKSIDRLMYELLTI